MSSVISQSQHENMLVNHIIRLLQILDYVGDESKEHQWMKTFLITPGSPRMDLMSWVLKQICPSEETSEIDNSPPHLKPQKFLQIFSSMGLCRPDDLELIECRASSTTQYEFWLLCLETVRRVRELPIHSEHQLTDALTADSLLDNVCHSVQFNHITKENGLNILPVDLRDKYKLWCKQGGHLTSIDDQLDRSLQQLQERTEEYQRQDSTYKETFVKSDDDGGDDDDIQSQVCEKILGVTKQGSLMQDVYTSYLAPWSTTPAHMELPQTGALVQEVNKNLDFVKSTLNLTREVKNNSEELEEKENILSRQSSRSSVISTLQLLANQSNVNNL